MPIIAIGKFYELRRPHMDGSREGQWCTFAEGHGMYYLLNGGRHNLCNILDMDDIPREIHFFTESECHQAAAAYYTKHCILYPYMAEWKALMGGADVKIDLGIESQVMRFD